MDPNTSHKILYHNSRKASAEQEISAIRKRLVEEAEELSDQRYDELTATLRALCHKNQYQDPQQELIRRGATQQKYDDQSPNDFEECLSFVTTFIQRKKKRAQVLDKVDIPLSDDGYSDMLDAGAIAPDHIYKKIIENPNDFQEIEQTHAEELKGLLRSEMFNQMKFNDALDGLLPSYAADFNRTICPP